MSFLDSVSPRAIQAPESGIVEILNYARGRDGLIPLWVGEGDRPTPNFISRTAADALIGGETFYTWQRGIPELRSALNAYYKRHFNVSLSDENFYVVGSGMQAIQLAVQALSSPGDEMVYLSPAWPNFPASLGIAGARAVSVEMDYVDGGWSVDFDRLEAAITSRTKALFINTPSNPTGWTATQDDLKSILELARRRDLWIIADEIYAQYYYPGERAPSFLDVMEADDRVIFVNSFSKNWSMTGWRVGWIVAPPELGQVIENLIQYSTSGVAQFMQRGAVVALNEGDDLVRENYEKAKAGRDIFCDALIATNRVQTRKSDGAIYTFFKIDGLTDSYRAAFDIADKANVGLAPGAAFGAGGAGFFRACFLRDTDQVREAADRLARYVSSL